MTVTTPPLTAGAYTVRWTAVTEDDNGTTNGTFSFTVAAAGSTSGSTTSGGSGTNLPATGALLALGFAARYRVRA